MACAFTPDMECERGTAFKRYPNLIPWIYGYAWLFLTFLIVLVCNGLIYKSIRDQEKKNQAYGGNEIVRRRASLQEIAQSPGTLRRQHSTSSSRSGRNSEEVSSRAVLFQNILYVSFSFSTAIWFFLPWLGAVLQVPSGWRFFFAIMGNLCFPLQGFINLFIYVRPRYLKLRNENSEWSFFKALGTSLAQAP